MIRFNHAARRIVTGTVGAAIGAAACLFTATSPAMASGVDTPRSVRVYYRDLDLNSPAGRASLQRRIAGAARLVCDADGRTIEIVQAEHACMRHALETVQMPQAQAIAIR